MFLSDTLSHLVLPLILCNDKIRGNSITRILIYWPTLLSSIMVGVTWKWLFSESFGFVNYFLIVAGLEPVKWFSNPVSAFITTIVATAWSGCGVNMLIFIGALKQIPVDQYEAARIDGADSWTIFRKITLPLLAPTFLFVSTIALTNSFKLVDHVVIMTEGAPNNASTLLLYYIYQQGFTNFNYGVSSALTTVMLVLLMIVALPRFLSQDKKIHYN